MMMKIVFILLVTGVVLILVAPSLASDRKDRNNNRPDNRNEQREKENERREKEKERRELENQRREKEKERKENEKEKREQEAEKWKDAKKEIVDYVRDIKDEVKDTISARIIDKIKERFDNKDAKKEVVDYVHGIKDEVKDTISTAVINKIKERFDKKDAKKEIVDYVHDIKDEVKDTISAAVLDKIKERLDKKDKDDSSHDSNRDKSRDSDFREDKRRYRTIEAALGKEIENLAKEVKSKIVDQVLKRKEYIKSNVEEKINSIGQALEKLKTENGKDEDASEDAKAEAAKEKQLLKEMSSELEAAIENVIANEVNGSVEPSTTANGAVARLLLHKLLQEFQPAVNGLRDSWKGFVGAELAMKEKAKQLHATEVVDGKPRSTFTFEKLNSFKSSLKEMLEKKKEFVEQKIELKGKVLFALRNMSLVHREKTGKAFSYVEFLESVLNGTIQLPKVLSDLFEDIKDAVEEIKEEEQVEPEIPVPPSSDVDSVPDAVDVTTSATEDIPEESSVLEILNTVQQMESDLSSQISALEHDAKAKVLEQVQKIRDVIANLVLEERTEEEDRLSSNVTSGNLQLDDAIRTAINNLISGNVSELILAGNEAILDLLMQNVLKQFNPSIQRLKLWSEQFQRIRGILATIADNLQKAVDEAPDVSQVSIDLTQYKNLLVEIHNVKALYTAERDRVQARFLEALERITSAYQNRTGTDLSEVLSILQNSSSALTPLLGDFYSDLSTLARADGLKFEATDPGASDTQGGAGGSSSLVGGAVVGTIVVVLAALGIGFYTYRRHRRQRLYTKI